MHTLLTLDYEVFFGSRTGSVSRCLLEPGQALLDLARRHGAKLVFFVDAGYLLKLREAMRTSAPLRVDYTAVCRQLEGAAKAGHELQLHVHPHWEDSRWDEANGWQIDATRYALQSFPPAQVGEIVAKYARAIRELGGPNSAFAYRAGGWVLQPFAPLRDALLRAGVTIDSTVFPGGYRRSAIQPFDFRAAPRKSHWRFRDDPLVEDDTGPFLEVPIASRELGPGFFWRLALARKLGGVRHRAFGDGEALATEKGELLAKLLDRSTGVVSIDGFKASYLARAAKEYRRQGMDDFVVIGHPKALTPFGLERLDHFLATPGENRPRTATFARYLDRAPRQRFAA